MHGERLPHFVRPEPHPLWYCLAEVNGRRGALGAEPPCQLLEQVGKSPPTPCSARFLGAQGDLFDAEVCNPLDPSSRSDARRTARTRARTTGASAASADLDEEWGFECGSPRDLIRPTGGSRRAVFGGRRYQPGSIAACADGAWSFVYHSLRTGEQHVRRFACKSWRCRSCAPLVNKRDADRIEDALKGVKLEDALFLTFTFDRTRRLGAAKAWRDARECWKRLRDALAYRYSRSAIEDGKHVIKKARIVYVQTWEQHKDGWPHVHALVWSPDLADEVRACGHYNRRDKITGEFVREPDGSPRKFWRFKSRVLEDIAKCAGFGPVIDVQFPRADRGALAGYLVKLAKELTHSAHKDQTPLAAPMGFRRIRASPHFLAPLNQPNPDWTGSLITVVPDIVERALEIGFDTFKQLQIDAQYLMEKPPWRRRRNARSAEPCSTPVG